MIISVSRRTDIPAYYSPWFLNRLREGYVLVPNPFDPKVINRVSLGPAAVDGMVFWTKNPAPLLPCLDRLGDHPYYFQYTLNAYGRDVEPGLPALDQKTATFIRLSDEIGKERIVWRYDPVLLNGKYTPAFHREAFARIASALEGRTEKCVFGFVDFYRRVSGPLRKQGALPPTPAETEALAEAFKRTADRHGIVLHTCTTKTDFRRWGILPNPCVDPALLERIGGYPLTARKDRNQRPECLCAESIDIGTYGCCPHGCLYCYANGSGRAAAQRDHGLHHPDSPLLIGELPPDAVIRERPVKSLRSGERTLF